MKFEYGLYPVITEEFCKSRSMLEVLKSVIDGGVKIVQLRQKKTSKKELYELSLKYREITLQNDIKLIINDHLDIALAVKADGVHLGQNDLPCSAARKLAPHLIIGVSTHNKEEIIRAEEDGATYINIGPIFSTETKDGLTVPLGLEYLKLVSTKLPFSVMGGIKRDNIVSILECGVKNIAMVTEITMAGNIKETTSELVNIIKRYLK